MAEIGNGICTKAFKATGKDMTNLRRDLQLNQKEFAGFLGVSIGTVATWERRSEKPLSGPANVLYHLAESKTKEARLALKKALEELRVAMNS